MIYPIALIERWPGPEYTALHSSMDSALRHNVADARQLLQDIEILKAIETTWESPDVSSKQGKYNLKRLGDQALNKRVTDHIIAKCEQYERITKFSDYPAMIMSGCPESQFIPYKDFWNIKETTQGPVLVRGIAAGKIINWLAEQKRDYYFIETGYLGNYPSENNRTGRKIYHRIVKNSMQHGAIMQCPDDRWAQLTAWNPDLVYRGWRKGGHNILLILPSEKSCRHFGVNKTEWTDQVLREIALHTDRPVIMREKAGRAERTNDTIYHAFDQNIHCVVTYNSIAAVEAVSWGIPAIALAPTAADPVCGKSIADIENPYRPDSELVQHWLHHMAYCQFSIDEMVMGRAWQLVQENEQRPTLNC